MHKWNGSLLTVLSNQLAIATVMAENEYNLTIDRQIKRDLTVDGIAWNFQD
jgi:hypothetical protein